MRIDQLLPGDIIFHVADDDHAMVWVGGSKPLVENVDSGDFNGVVRHSDKKIRLEIQELGSQNRSRSNSTSSSISNSSSVSNSSSSSLQRNRSNSEPRKSPPQLPRARSQSLPTLFPAQHQNTNSRVGSNSFSDSDREDHNLIFEVFRCEDSAIARRAAEFAIEWAVSTSSPQFIEGMKVAEENSTPLDLNIKFNQDRLGHTRQQKGDHWDARSLLRALRVLGRRESSVPLSIKGWTCSSFTTYCFQAAALDVRFHQGTIDPGLLQSIRKSGAQKFLSIKNDLNLIEAALSEPAEFIRKVIPKALGSLDGKAVDASLLREVLQRSGSGFTCMGSLNEI